MGSKKKQTVGHRYFFGLHMGVGRGPMDELVAIKVGDRVAWTGSVTTNTSIQINQPGLFGGDDREGGIVGQLDVMMGAPTQAPNAALVAMLGGLVPAFRGVVTTFFDGLMCSGSPYPKPWTFRWRRALMGWDGEPWYPAKAVITMAGPAGEPIKAMNPAHILYECFTNADWGRGLPRARLDDAVWVAAADKLHAEGFGLCLKWSRQDAITAFMQGVIDHIGGVQFADPATGLIVLRLIRDDYVVASLPLFDADSGLLAIDDDDAASQTAGINEVVVRYRSPLDGKDRQVRVKNPAAIHALGGVSSTTKDYPGLPTAALALRVAQRDLRVSTGFIKKFKVRLDRRGYQVLPGSVFRIRDLKRGISEMVLRAGRVENGPLTEGAITITALQDVFGLPATSYVAAQVSGYVPPVTTPLPVTLSRLVELPYRDRLASGADLPDATAGFLAALAVAPSGLSQSFDLRTRVGGAGPFVQRDNGAFCPSGVITTATTCIDTAITLTGPSGLAAVAVGSAALVDEEVVRIESIDLGTAVATIARGCADTVPAVHAVGARVFFYEDFGAADATEYSTGTTVAAKLVTRTGAGVLAESAAAVATLMFAGRLAQPYPPADLRVNGERYPAMVTAVTLAVLWRHRHRVLQADQLVDTLASDIGPEAGTTYSWRLVATVGNVVVASGSGSAVASAGISAKPSGQYRLEVWSVRAGLSSLQRASHEFWWDQSGTYLDHTITLSGVFTAGLDIVVLAGAAVLANYRTTVADGSLAGVAASLASEIDGTSEFTAFSAGAVVTVTGPLGITYALSADVSRQSIGFNLVQTAAYASAGSSYTAALFVNNAVTGASEPVAPGVTFTVYVERPAGTAVGNFSYTTTAYESKLSVFNGLYSAMAAHPTLFGLGYGLSIQYSNIGYSGLFVGPVGVLNVHLHTLGSSPFELNVSIISLGSAPVPADRAQVIDVTVTLAPVAGEVYRVTLDGVDYSYTAGAGDGVAAVAAGLATAIDAAAGFSATSSGAIATVTGAVVAVPFTYQARIVCALLATVG